VDQELELLQLHQALPLVQLVSLEPPPQLQELELDMEQVQDMEHQQAAALQALNQVPHMDNQVHHMDKQVHHMVKQVHQLHKAMAHLIKEKPEPLELLEPLEHLALPDQELAHHQADQLIPSKQIYIEDKI
jgi:predicted transcriptional regulator